MVNAITFTEEVEDFSIKKLTKKNQVNKFIKKDSVKFISQQILKF